MKRLDNKGFAHHLALMLAIVIVGIGGSLYLVLSHADTPPNCSVLTTTSKSLQLCTNIMSTNALNATAVYVGQTSKDILASGSLSLYQCTATASPTCDSIASSSTVLKPNAFIGRKYSQIKTPNAAYLQSSVYKACVAFTSTSGWNVSTTCTSLVSFGTGYKGTVTLYKPPTAQTTPSPTQTTTPQAKPTCNGEALSLKSDGTPWVCTFSDEFNGGALDRTIWTPQTTAGSGFATNDTKDNNARACFMDNAHNVSVSSGYLNLTAYQEAAPFTCTDPQGNFTTSYTAGEVMSQGKFSQQYGRFEVSAKLPATTTKGLQETLWLWPNNDLKYGAWPASGEIDFAEFYSSYSNFTVPYIHYFYDSSTVNFNTHTNIPTPVYGYDSNFNNCYLNVGAFNTYTAIWQSGYIELDVNDKPCVVNHYSSTTGAVPAPFDQPFFIALTQGLGIWPVDKSTGKHLNASQDNAFVPGTTPLPATTQVDYVRVWK